MTLTNIIKSYEFLLFFQVLLNHNNMKYTSLCQISPDNDTWIIKVRIIRMWDAVNIAQGNELISLDLIMSDENVSSH
jgi:hypothetical protein